MFFFVYILINLIRFRWCKRLSILILDKNLRILWRFFFFRIFIVICFSVLKVFLYIILNLFFFKIFEILNSLVVFFNLLRVKIFVVFVKFIMLEVKDRDLERVLFFKVKDLEVFVKIMCNLNYEIVCMIYNDMIIYMII